MSISEENQLRQITSEAHLKWWCKLMEQEQKRFPVFSERFNQLRDDMTQGEFADFLGISRPTVGFYENGDRIPDALTLRAISEKCNVSADWLLGLTKDRKRKPSAVDDLGLSESAIDVLTDLCINKNRWRHRMYSDILSALILSEHFESLVIGLPDLAEIVRDAQSERAEIRTLFEKKERFPLKEHHEKIHVAEKELTARLGYKVRITLPSEQINTTLNSLVFWATDMIKEVSGYYEFENCD